MLLLIGAGMGHAFAQNEAVTLRSSSNLWDAPSDTANNLGTLPPQSVLYRLPVRQGRWQQVRTSTGQTGWVHMFDLLSSQSSSPTSNSATGALRAIGNLFGKDSSASKQTATSTIGVRGLNAEDIANAQPNLQAVDTVESWRADATQARNFAKQAMWLARTVEPLPQPADPSPTSAPLDPDTRPGHSK